MFLKCTPLLFVVNLALAQMGDVNKPANVKPPFYERYEYHRLFGAGVEERPPVLEDGSINCVVDGVDYGFHCLMRPKKGVTEPGSALTQNKNADLCYDKITARKLRKGDNDDVHCHGSYDSSLYRYVILDHLNRGYEGVLDCMCGYGPVGFVSDCDITNGDDDYDRYDTGSQNCTTGLKARDRRSPYRWMVRRWGVRYLDDEDLELYNEYLEEEGLNDDRRRNGGCKQEIVYDDPKDSCGEIIKIVNTCKPGKVRKTTMTRTKPECVIEDKIEEAESERELEESLLSSDDNVNVNVIGRFDE